MSNECATATLPESLASHLIMSGGPSNCSRSLATSVTVREMTECIQSTSLGTAGPQSEIDVRSGARQIFRTSSQLPAVMASLLAGSQPEWPPCSPDLNLVDYSIWSILEARVCAKPHKNLVPLKQSLQRGWERLSLEELRSTALNCWKLLTVRIVADGDLFRAN